MGTLYRVREDLRKAAADSARLRDNIGDLKREVVRVLGQDAGAAERLEKLYRQAATLNDQLNAIS